MTETIRLGRLAGVRVGLHWSVLIVVALLVLGLGLGRFPLLRPDYPLALHLTAGVIAAALFVGSLLAHELAHAVVARRNGVEVEGITLWLLGGVAQLRGDAATPRRSIPDRRRRTGDQRRARGWSSGCSRCWSSTCGWTRCWPRCSGTWRW